MQKSNFKKNLIPCKKRNYKKKLMKSFSKDQQGLEHRLSIYINVSFFLLHFLKVIIHLLEVKGHVLYWAQLGGHCLFSTPG
jgi:hypothetical protein